MFKASVNRASAVLLLAVVAQSCGDHNPLAPVSPRSPEVSPTLALTPGPVRDIRIGVVQAASSITLGSSADYTVTEKGTGVVLVTGTNGGVTVTRVAAATPFLRLQVTCASAANVAARKAAAEAAGYVTLTEFFAAGNCTRLYLGQLPTNATTAQRNAFKAAAVASGHAASDAFYRVVAIGPAGGYHTTYGSTVKFTANPVRVSSSTDLIKINGSVYRGVGEAIANSVGSLAGVNELPVEKYLYGVVPRELGPSLYPEFEAQKAQAIAARTYSLSGLNKRASDGYDLRATTDDQVYGGYSAEHPISNAAVDATAGEVATYNGALIQALFSSTSGGHTANNEEAFASAPVPYLRGVPDAERGKSLEHVPTIEVFRAHGNPASLRATRAGDFEAGWHRFHRWTFEWTAAEISSVISDFAQRPVGKVLEINVVERGPSGRATRVEYVTEAGTFVSVRDGTRAALKFITATGGRANLLSTLFFVEPVIDKKTKEVSGFRVFGGGFGHGVGLAQTGAVGMAERGHTYDEILKHYYQGIAITKWY